MNNELTGTDKLYLKYIQGDWRISYSHIYALWKKRKLIFGMLGQEFGRKKEHQRILDVGCGNGEYLFWLEERFGKKYRLIPEGIDLSPDLIEAAKKRVFFQNKTGFNFSTDDIESSSFSAGTKEKYDVVICLEVLEHLKSPATAIENIKKMTKPGGLIIIATPNNTSFTTRLEQFLAALKKEVKDNGLITLFNIPKIIKITNQAFSRTKLPELHPDSGYGHISEKSTGEWIKICKQAGLKIEQIKRTNLFFGGDFLDRHPVLFGAILWVDTLLDYLPFGPARAGFCWEHILKLRVSQMTQIKEHG